MTETTAVLVIGGGYAGAMAASRLTQRPDLSVSLINPRPAFVDRIRLHQRVAGTDDAVIDYHEILGERVELIIDTVTRINAVDRTVDLDGGGTLDYDYLIYAVGSHTARPGVPGAAEFGYPIATLEEVQRLEPVLAAAPSSAAVTVVGAGPAGIETAAELAEQGRRVTLVCGGELGPTLHPRGRRSVRRQLGRLGVRVIDGPGSVVTAATADAVLLAGGDRLDSAVTIWTAGFSAPDLATRSGLTTDAVGRMITDESLTSIDDVRIVATGDAAAPSGIGYRMSCQAAVQLGPQAADTVLSRINGERPGAVEAGFAGLCISLGRRAGIYQFVRGNDSARSYHIGGIAGGVVKEQICRGIVDQLVAHEARKPGARLWRGSDPDRPQQVAMFGDTARAEQAS